MKIAVAIDGSDNALRAAEHAIMLTTYLPKAELEVIYVADYKKAVDDRLLSQNPEGLALKREQILHPVLERTDAAEIDVKTTILKGNPSQEIIKYVNDEKIVKLVLVSRCFNVYLAMLVGSYR